MEKKALGRGLSALITPREIDQANTTPVQTESVQGSKDLVVHIKTSQIKTNKYQPRLDFNEAKMSEMVNSIKEKGVIQPILVRKYQGGYELIAGERRLRAVKTVGLETIPAIVREVGDVDMLELALVENIQREDLNSMEEAYSYHKFMTDFGFTQEKIAKVIGKERSTIANIMRLINLPLRIQDFISTGAITAGHAKALLALQIESSQNKLCDLIIEKGLSVRETENLINNTRTVAISKPSEKKDPLVVDLETRLQQVLGTKVKIKYGKKRGKIQIEYFSSNDLNRILDLILAKKT
jgi:ParB family chromosome partitioning protein